MTPSGRVVVALVALLVVCTLGSLSRSKVWWVRMLDFPRLQLFVCGIALAAGAAVVLDQSTPVAWLAIGVAVACAVYQAWWIWPFTPLHRPQVPRAARSASPGRRLRVLVSNVLTPNRNADALLRLVRENDPEVVVTLESDVWWQQRLDTLAVDYPHSLKCPLDNLYGMHLYSKLAISQGQIRYVVQDDVPSMHLLVTLDGGDVVELHCLHPAPPAPGENETSAPRDAELVIVGREAAKSPWPAVVLGDLNDVAWSRTTRQFRKVSRLLDPRIGRGLYNTFHAGHWFLRWPLDHLFHSDHFELVAMRRLPTIGSDHFPILVELALKAARPR